MCNAKLLLKISSLLIVFILLSVNVYSQDEIVVTKVKGKFGLMNLGSAQGFEKGQRFQLVRSTSLGEVNIGEVIIAACKTNFSGIKLTNTSSQYSIKVGDKVVLQEKSFIYETAFNEDYDFSSSYRLGSIFHISRGGIKLGYNSANFFGKDWLMGSKEFTASKSGFIGGLFIYQNIAPMFGIQEELLYTQKGIIYKGDVDDVIFGVDYLQLTVLAKLDMLSGRSVLPNAYFGPGFAFKTASHLDGEVQDENLNGFYTSLIFGGGVDFVVGRGRFTIDARYDLGLSKIFKDAEVKHHVFSIITGFSF